MADTWQLLTDDARERATFATLAATLALPVTPAGPPNRLRRVLRCSTEHGVYYLKIFAVTQWQNRLRFRLTAPLAHDDAEREWRVTAALRANGFAAPRPVARGRLGRTSYYLCAELPGRPLTDLLRNDCLSPAQRRQVAEHCGRLLASGFRLPDLSADHVFCSSGEVVAPIAILDLHNGGIGDPGPAAAALARRVLRRFARSVRDLALPLPPVLRFALRLLRAAGLPARQRRRLLTSAPPWATAGRYEDMHKSCAYAERNPTRSLAEVGLLRSVWPGRPGELVLDLPCGAGRLLPLLRDQFGHRVVQADGALAMLLAARRSGPAAPAVRADALAMPFATGSCDGVVMFRFLHHLAGEAQRGAIAEACRVARRFVVVSFFHPCSAHHLQRCVRQLFGGAPTRFTTTLGRLRRWFAAHGLRLCAHAAEASYRRDLWVAAFVRDDPAAPLTLPR